MEFVARELQEAAVEPGPLSVDVSRVVDKVSTGLIPDMPIEDVVKFAVETSGYMALQHPDYGVLAGRLLLRQLGRSVPSTYSVATEVMARHSPGPVVSPEYAACVARNAAVFDDWVATAITDLDHFGMATLMRSYLLKVDGVIGETPAMMYMRTAVFLHKDDLPAVKETFDLLVAQEISHATPTLFNAGTCCPQLASCFLLPIREDSIKGIYDTLGTCATISKHAGGIGLSIHNVRAAGSAIRGTNGTSNGIVPMLRVYNATSAYVDQGGGKRKGSIAVYLEPWHADVMGFLGLAKNVGPEDVRARDLFTALWVPDLFMRRVLDGGSWSLFCPSEAPGLAAVFGPEFDALYIKYEAEGRARSVIPAQKLWDTILATIAETGRPYVLFKDTCNARSNQKNLGCIPSSNLCAEIVQYSSPDETATCNLAAVVLDSFVEGPGVFNFTRLETATRVLVRNLNLCIELTYYAEPTARTSNTRHRPIGVGVVGLADAFAAMGYAYDSPEAAALNVHIFESMYYAAVSESCELAKRLGPYETFAGSPTSRGELQFDLAGVAVSNARYDWTALKDAVVTHGLRNSLLLAVMPTASTAQIIGRTESIEAPYSLSFSRSVLAGTFPVVNRRMVADLEKAGVWTEAVRQYLGKTRGSLQGAPGVPEVLQARYKTVWEVKHAPALKLAAARQPFICQSQSLNVYIADADRGKLTGAYTTAWRLGMKTGGYYFRTQSAATPTALGGSAGTGRAPSPVPQPTPEEPDPVCTSCVV